jgi:hydroxylamine reductase (hybrid-cluster protein)
MDKRIMQSERVDFFMKALFDTLVQKKLHEKRIDNWILLGDDLEAKKKNLKEFYGMQHISFEMIMFFDNNIYDQKCTFMTNNEKYINDCENVEKWLNADQEGKDKYIMDFNLRKKLKQNEYMEIFSFKIKHEQDFFDTNF